MKNFVLFFLIFIIHDVYCQEDKPLMLSKKLVYYGSDFRTESTEMTEYKRAFEVINDSILIRDFVRDTLFSEYKFAHINSYKSATDFLLYYASGSFKMYYKPFFKDLYVEILQYCKLGLLSRTEYKNDKLYTSIIYHENDLSKNLLNKGTGVKIYQTGYQEQTLQSFFRDSLFLDQYIVRPFQNDTIYIMVDVNAEPINGYDQFYSYLSSVLQYPKIAQFFGVEGIVKVGFVVDKNGMVTEFEVNSKGMESLEKEAKKKLEKMPQWKPAYKDGRPVKTSFALPIRFKLTR